MAILLGTLNQDTIDGTLQADIITALAGNDTIVGNAGADLIDGGDGDDIIYAASRSSWSDGAVDTVLAGLGNDHVYGAYGDALDGGLGFDTLSLDLSDADSGVSVDFRPMTIGIDIGLGVIDRITIPLGSSELGNFEAVDRLIGSAFADRLILGNQDRVASDVDGGTGDDFLRTGRGDDRLDGGGGVDTLRGGKGDDTYLVDARHDRVAESFHSGHDHVIASASYGLRANVEDLTLTGDAVRGRGNDGRNVIEGSGVANRLNGLGGNDVVDGGNGNDRIAGGAGRDTLTGGNGSDTFLFRDGDTGIHPRQGDIITDFSHAEGDRISLHAIDAITGGANDRFTFIGEARFSHTAGELRFVHVDGNTFVSGDVNGDGRADFSIQLQGVVDLVANDFQL